MTITIEFDDELKNALQYHLDTSLPIQSYIKSAIRYFDYMRAQELKGFICGFGNKERFESYNTKVSPKEYLTD